MKRIFLLLALGALCTGAVSAQKSGDAPLNTPKKAEFVYPQEQLGVWKVSLVSCVGIREFSSVALTIRVVKVSGSNAMYDCCLLTEAQTTDGEKLGFGKYSADPHYDFKINTPVELTLQGIGNVPDEATAIDVKFFIGNFADAPRNIFEGRNVPITWQETATAP